MNKKNIVIIVLFVLLGVLSFIFFPSKNKVTYTDEESKWISENKDKIFFMGYYNSPGEALFVKKLCQILSKETGLNIVPYDDTWYNNMWLLERGKIQMCSTLNVTPERLKYINYTTPFKGLSSGIYSTFNDPIDQYEDIKGKRIGIVKGVKYLDMFRENYKGISFNPIIYDDIDSMIKALRSWEIDGYISTKNYDESTRDFYYFNIPSISKNNNYIGVHKYYPQLYSIIAKQVDYLIEMGWGDTIREAINFELEKRHLPFNETEMEYLNTNPVINIGIIDGHILSGYKKDYSKHGIIPNVFKKIEFLTGVEFRYIFDSYKNLLKNEDVDLITTFKKNNEEFIYSNPIYSYEISVLGKKNMRLVKEVYDLEPYRVGVFANGPENEYLVQEMPKINIKEYNKFSKLIHSAEISKSEYILVPNILADAYLAQFKGLSRKGILYERFNYMMTRDNRNIALISLINKCLAVMDMDAIVHQEVEILVNYRTDDKATLVFVIGGILALVGITINLIIKKSSTQCRLMYTDRETGVNNRLWLEKKLKKDIDNYTFFEVKLKDLFILYECYGYMIYKKALRKAIKSIQEKLKDKDMFSIIDKETFVIAKANMIDSDAEVFAYDLERLFGERMLVYDMSYNLRGIVGWTTKEDDINELDGVLECLSMAIYFSEKKGKPVQYTYDIFIKYKERFEFDREFVSAVMNEKIEVLYRNVYDADNQIFALDTTVTCCLDNYGELNSKAFYEATKRLNFQSQVDVIMLKSMFNQLKTWEHQGKAINIMVSLSNETIEKDSFIPWLSEMMEGLENIQLLIKLDGNTLENHLEQFMFLDHENIDFLVKSFGSDVLNMIEIKKFPFDIVCIDNDYILNIGENKLYDDAFDYVISMAKKLNKKIMITDIMSKHQYDMIMKRDIDYVSGNYIKSYVRGEEIFYEHTYC